MSLQCNFIEFALLQPGPVDQPAEKLDQWKKNIVEIASECPNVSIKCGGYQMVNGNMRLEQRAVPIGSEELCDKVLPIYKHVIQSFTPERCMFESNVRLHPLLYYLAPDTPSSTCPGR